MNLAYISILGIFLLFLMILLWRAIRLGGKAHPLQPEKKTGAVSSVDSEAISTRLAEALRFKTISSLDDAGFDQEAFLGLHQYFQTSFPLVHNTLRCEVVNRLSLFYTWQGSDPALAPGLLMGHIDVVPVEEASKSAWTHDAFAGEIADGFIWGRGTMDNKGPVLATFEAIEALLQSGFQPKRTLYFAIGHDEEVGGTRGACQIVSMLKERNVRLEYVLDEGLAVVKDIMPGVQAPVALVGLAEKGFVNLLLTVEQEGGHSSIPYASTAIGILSDAVRRLEQNRPSARLDEPAREMFLTIAPYMSFLNRLIFANLWLFKGIVIKRLSANPATDANIRSTTAPTMFQAGVKDNVLPTQARAVVNYRIIPGDTSASVLAHARRVIHDRRVQIEIPGGFTSEPSPISSTSSLAFVGIKSAIQRAFPGSIPAPGLVLGATDCRHYQTLSDCCYRFTPLVVAPADLSRVHGIDERVSVENYAQMIAFYISLISRMHK